MDKKNNPNQIIRESEAIFNAITNQASEGITVADMDGNYKFVNPAFCEMSGYSEAELLKMTVFQMKAKTQSENSFYESKGEREGKVIRVNLQRKDGTEYLTEIIGDIIVVENEKLVLGTIRDITEREKAEREIKELNDNLESLVEERTKKLNETVLQLESEIDKRINAEEKIYNSLAEKEILLNEITHRVKNNLQIISSLINLQKRSVSNQESIDVLDQAANRIYSMGLIHETLCHSNSFGEVKFGEYTTALVQYITKAFDTTNIDISTNIEEFDISIDKATNCGMILMELISNSIKYAFIGKSDGQIDVVITNVGGNKITVSDNGVGFPKGVDYTNTNTLGMQIVFSLTDQIDGELNLIDKEGTTFELTF